MDTVALLLFIDSITYNYDPLGASLCTEDIVNLSLLWDLEPMPDRIESILKRKMNLS